MRFKASIMRTHGMVKGMRGSIEVHDDKFVFNFGLSSSELPYSAITQIRMSKFLFTKKAFIYYGTGTDDIEFAIKSMDAVVVAALEAILQDVHDKVELREVDIDNFIVPIREDATNLYKIPDPWFS